MQDEINQWEYHVHTIGPLFGTKDEAIEETLNDLGEAGWGAVSVDTPEGSGKVTIVVKRPMTGRTRRERSRPALF